ncbi:MAG: hypothetical protein J3K34DRAFT_524672 [Monoraphidium minutum]|nr:MAG: hypothetical protein J3K34DRAFT_524672 [Monoraphidium minutum]
MGAALSASAGDECAHPVAAPPHPGKHPCAPHAGGAAAAAMAGGEAAAAWRAHWRARLVSIDAYTLLIATFNLIMAWDTTAYIGSFRVRAALKAGLAAIAATSLATRLLLALRPAAYARSRTALVLAQRLVRGAWSLLLLRSLDARSWLLYFERKGGQQRLQPLLSVLVVYTLLWVMQGLWFPPPLRLAAPLQAALCAASYCFMARNLGCYLHQDAPLLGAARALCRHVQGARQVITVFGGVAVPGAAAQMCSDAPAEFLVAFCSTLACLIPLYAYYATRRGVRAGFDARLSGGRGAEALPPPRALHVVVCLCLLAACFVAAEAVMTACCSPLLPPGAAAAAAVAPCGARPPPGAEDAIEERFDLLAAALVNVERRARLLAQRLAAAEAQNAEQEDMLELAQEAICEMQAQQVASRDREQLLQHDVARLSALLEAEKLQAVFAQERVAGALGEERRRRERAERTHRDAVLQRDDALAELRGAYSDIDAMQATLADSALYVRQLRRRLLELEVRSESAAASAHAAAAAAARDQSEHSGAFSVASVRAAIQAEVRDAAACEPQERRRRVRALQLRWHPDKNPAPLRELATEVTKIINHALEQAEQHEQGAAEGAARDAASAGGGNAGGGSGGDRQGHWRAQAPGQQRDGHSRSAPSERD